MTITTIIAFLIILSVLVLVHELGHFLVSRKFGAKAEEFGLGFPPRLIGFYKSISGKWKFTFWTKEVEDAADTIYSINLFPIGGFVKIQGEDGEKENDTSSFRHKKIWQRALILSAGVIMNFLLAFVIISGTFLLGSYQPIEGLPEKGAIIRDSHLEVIGVSPDSPAAKADIKTGDRIISINEQEIKSVQELQDYVSDKAGQNLTYKLKRGEEEINKQVIPVVLKETNRGGIGISPAQVGFIRYPWYLAFYEGIKTTALFFWLILTSLFDLVFRLFSGVNVSGEVAGIVGIAVVTGQAVSQGITYLFQLTAMLSLSLAVFNILPIPGLDGGRLLFLIIEKIKGRPVKAVTETIVHNIGIIFLLALMALVTFNDIKRLFN